MFLDADAESVLRECGKLAIEVAESVLPFAVGNFSNVEIDERQWRLNKCK